MLFTQPILSLTKVAFSKVLSRVQGGTSNWISTKIGFEQIYSMVPTHSIVGPPFRRRRCWNVSQRWWSVSRRCWSVSRRCWSVSRRCWSVSRRCWNVFHWQGRPDLITSNHPNLFFQTFEFLISWQEFGVLYNYLKKRTLLSDQMNSPIKKFI